jgi:magnesium-protoporphyrin O-methyltransferase
MSAFVPAAALPRRGGGAPRTLSRVPPRALPRAAAPARMMAAPPVDDKAVVTEYFNNTGFERWRRIYSEAGEVNRVQRDIRDGHAATVGKILAWVDADGDAAGMTVADAGCGVGSVAIPLAARGAVVSASDISAAMVREAEARAAAAGVAGVRFAVADLETLGGRYDTVVCVDVMIHYPRERMGEMVAHLAAAAERRVIVTFAPRTVLLAALKKVGEFFPGPSKATRAYLHDERDVVAALERAGFAVARTDFSGSRFYFSRILEAVRRAP